MSIIKKSETITPRTKTETVSVFARDRAVLRALAGTFGRWPADVVRDALRAYAESDARVRSVAEAVQATFLQQHIVTAVSSEVLP